MADYREEQHNSSLIIYWVKNRAAFIVYRGSGGIVYGSKDICGN